MHRRRRRVIREEEKTKKTKKTETNPRYVSGGLAYFMKVSSSVELAWIGGAGLGSFLPPRMARYPRRKVPPRVAMESYI